MRKQTGQMVGDGPLLQLHNLLQNDSDMYCCVVELSRRIVMRHCGVLTVVSKEGYEDGNYSKLKSVPLIT